MASKRIVAKFTNESALLKSITRMKEKEVSIIDAFGPFATHDILKKITKESRLPYLAVLYGIIALAAMFSLIYYTAVIDYPLIYGGKPVFSFPPMVVLMFLVCILLITIFSVLTFHARAGIFPGKTADLIGRSVTDDSFYLLLTPKDNSDEIESWLREDHAEIITEKDNT